MTEKTATPTGSTPGKFTVTEAARAFRTALGDQRKPTLLEDETRPLKPAPRGGYVIAKGTTTAGKRASKDAAGKSLSRKRALKKAARSRTAK